MMAMKKQLLIGFCLLSLGVLTTRAQSPTTQGTEFWASFMRNGYNSSNSYDHFTLIASAKHACTVTVTNPNTGWSDQFQVPNNGVSTCYVNRAQGYNDQMGGKAFKGLHITSTDTISLYIANEAENSYDAANVLPASALGSEYMLQSYKALGDQSSHYGDSRASFLVLATENNTEVQITPSCQTYDNHNAGRPYTVSLNRGECYHVLNKNAGTTTNVDGDFSGTMVVSADDKPIAVFNGNSITSVPGGLSTGYDHIFEQAMPTNYWGKQFVVTSTRCPSYMNLSPDQIKVTALFDNTTVMRDGATLFTLNAGESNHFEMNLVNEPCTYLEADNPIAVFLYQHSHGSGNPAYGDPSMVWISPVEQTVYEVTFSTFEVQEVEVHFVNVVCYTENVSGMTLDGSNISSSFAPVPGSPDYSYARLQLNHAAHTLRCPRGFVAHVYGIGQAEGYAYSVGSSAKTLTNQLFVNNELVLDDYSTCQSEVLQFRLETNYEPDLVKWSFGDGSPIVQGPSVSHTYQVVDDYQVEVMVDHVVNGEPQTDTLGMIVHVNPTNEFWVEDSTCLPIYRFHGKEFDVPYFGEAVFPSDVGCDTIYHLSITEGSSQSFVTSDTACMEYLWFDTIRYESGTYLVILNQPGGCDSLYILHLTIGEPPEEPVTHYSSCDTYYWHGNVCNHTDTYYASFTTKEGCVYDSILYFTLTPTGQAPVETVEACDSYFWQDHLRTETGVYHETVTGDNGCETYLTLDLTIYHTPPFEEIMGLGNIAVATTFWPGKYKYYLDCSEGMLKDSIHWELNPPIWQIEPYGDTCLVTATAMGSATLKVWTTGNGDCDKMKVKTIHAGGFGVEEQDIIPVTVYPNPTRDELIVEADDMERVAVYDLRGQKVKEVAAQQANLVRIAVNDLVPSLYLVEVRTRMGNKTKLFAVIR